jgi:hypothetical protein
MKKFILFFFVSSTFLLLFQSCQKEISFDDMDGITGNLRAKIDGNQWVANKGASASRIQGYINITGYSTDKKYLVISLKDSGVHRYTLSDVTMNAAGFTDSTQPNPLGYATNQGDYPAESGGEVNITAIDTVNKK